MEEFLLQNSKGTDKRKMLLDQKTSDQRFSRDIYIFFPGTRREELLFQPWELEKINLIRRGLAGHKPEEAIQRLLMFVKKFPTNAEMLKGIPGYLNRRRLPVLKRSDPVHISLCALESSPR